MTGNYNKYTNQRFIKLKLWFIHRYEYVKGYGIITEGMVISAGDFGGNQGGIHEVEGIGCGSWRMRGTVLPEITGVASF